MIYGKDRWLRKDRQIDRQIVRQIGRQLDRQIDKLDRWLRIDVVEQISTFIFAYNKKYGE